MDQYRLNSQAHESCRTLPDTLNMWAFFQQPDPLLRKLVTLVAGESSEKLLHFFWSDNIYNSIKKQDNLTRCHIIQ